MKPSELKSEIAARIRANIKRAILIEGAPGLGKTQIISQIAEELSVGFQVIHAPLLQPEDYGFPVIASNRDNVAFIVSKDKFPVEGSKFPDKGILLIDEISQCDNSAQKILANLIQAREIHGQKLKEGWFIVATGNRTTDRAGANRILSHLGGRVTRLPMDASLDDWCHWAIENRIATEVIAFLRFRPALLNDFDPQRETNPTPRAWAEGVSPSIGVVDPKRELPVFTGDVGEGAAAEFVGFLKLARELPNPDMILLDPKKAPIPAKQATLYALAGALSHKATAGNFDRLMTYVNRMPPEYKVLFIRDAAKRCPDVQTTPAFIDWATTEGAKLLS